MSPKSKRAVTRNQQLPSDDGNMTTEDEVVAYVDESMRTREGITTYYLCAVIDVGIREVDLDGLRSLMPSSAKKLHARDMGVALRGCALDAISKLDMSVIVVSGRPVNMRRQERARRKRLELGRAATVDPRPDARNAGPRRRRRCGAGGTGRTLESHGEEHGTETRRSAESAGAGARERSGLSSPHFRSPLGVASGEQHTPPRAWRGGVFSCATKRGQAGRSSILPLLIS